jgi:hypothetical protein
MHGIGQCESHHQNQHHQHCQQGGFHRHFRTQDERVAHLEEYLKQLQSEAKAVEERLAELKAAG